MGRNFDVFPGFQKFLAMRNIVLYSVCTENGNSSFFKPKIRGLYTRVVNDQEQVIVARVR